ncbi:MAG: hypothetical protein KatS3mg057_1146 [Herpetosiphonaceae bacterium]|nr:MAG: hypothetical protein KatS3mg057_1146 [Herpetosiphonaceae bacterium]
MSPSLRRLTPGLILLGGTLLIGTIGFIVIEGWSLVDAFYATVLIISTLGFGSIHPTVVASQLLTIALIAGGVGTLYYLLGMMAQGLIETQAGIRRERRLKEEIRKLRDHVIICGYGRVGQEVVRELRRTGCPFVVVDRDPQRIAGLKEQGMPCYAGDASLDTVLREVGIERARAGGLYAI